ncbi:hypothetical protein C0V82_05550 [Niveispirillum cyanobacteriorum]|uniref:Uncharacterized protein n=1 Tax=Niveispirillum cyanobacteriorum TaxID=1612173 RepID=A0A2K9N9I1_9PROT|nr:hypothetical protein C0V82_05550 [Niveispirillum cyanobacteriorum]GGE61176.1 hypothetical protein GCM10011317_18650 [Niveispirillum cyanobacteriorum]
MRHRFKWALLVLSHLFVTADTIAQDCSDLNIYDAENLHSAILKNESGPRLYFQRSAEHCPGGADCQAKAYLVPGDRVFLADEKGPYVCAMFRGKKRDTAGWLPRARLNIDATSAPPTREDWLGRWRTGENWFLVDAKEGGSCTLKV